MALVSRHYKICEAVRESIIADSEIVAVVSEWRIQKKFWNRYQPWEPGGFVIPQRRASPVYENELNEYIMPVLVGVVWPADASLQSGLEARMALCERIENTFNRTGRDRAPAPMVALSSEFTGADQFAFQGCEITPGDQFMDGAFARGFDAFATTVNVRVTARKRDS